MVPLSRRFVDPRPMAKYGPASLYTNENNGVDKLYWADAHDRGYATGGRIHVLVSDFLSAIHSPRSFSSSSTVAPTLSSDGKKIWIGGRGATVHGWDEQSLHPVFSTALTQSHRNESYRKCSMTNSFKHQSPSRSLHCFAFILSLTHSHCQYNRDGRHGITPVCCVSKQHLPLH